MDSPTGQVAMTLRHGQSVSLVHPDGTVCVVAPTPKQIGKCHIVIIAPKAVRIERDKETADEIERLRAECERLRKDGLRHIDTLVAERDEARARNVRLLSQLQEYEVREL